MSIERYFTFATRRYCKPRYSVVCQHVLFTMFRLENCSMIGPKNLSSIYNVFDRATQK